MPLQADSTHDDGNGDAPDRNQGAVSGKLRIALETDRVEECAAVGQHDQTADSRAQDARVKPSHEPGRDRRGHDAAEEERTDDWKREDREVQRNQEADTCTERYDELTRVDRADHLAWGHATRGEQRGSRDRPPAATADGIKETGCESKRNEKRHAQRSRANLDASSQERKADEHVGPEDNQEERDPGPGRLSVDIAQQRRASERPHPTGEGQPAHGFPVGVAELPVRGARGEGGPDFGQMELAEATAGTRPAASSSVVEVS